MQLKKLSPNDFRHLFSQDIEKMEARYSEPYIYKYMNFPNAGLLDEFLSRPTIKFAHKDELNDPFELSKRWLKFGCPFNKEIFDKYVHKPVESRLSSVVGIRKKLELKAKEKRPWVSRHERRKAVASKIGRREVDTMRKEILYTASTIEAQMPSAFAGLEGEFIEEFAKTTGILSLTDAPSNICMWRNYAADGLGFVIQFNAEHEFFTHRADDGILRKLIRPVFYREDRVDDFWKNPYYLFLVKELRWAFEQEWRVLRPLDECRKVVQAKGAPLYLVDAPKGLISSVVFGYNVGAAAIDRTSKLLLEFDSTIEISLASIEPNCGVVIKPAGRISAA